jgi:hypothetical protein
VPDRAAVASDAASFIHPQLADIKHDHCRDDGKLIKSMIEITGYPAAGNGIELAVLARNNGLNISAIDQDVLVLFSKGML